MGRYVPPEYEGVVSGNKLHKKKAPGTHGSTQTVRFEMPFNVFCLHCDGHIAQGVRFNAEKKKVGNYYSSPIFAFRMKHTTCGKWIEIQTDPKNTTYLCTEGAKKQAVADGGSETDKLKVQGKGIMKAVNCLTVAELLRVWRNRRPLCQSGKECRR